MMANLTVNIQGGLVSPDFLETIHDAPGQKPQDFGLKPRDSLVDEVSAVWGDARAYWEAFQRRLARARDGRSESQTTITREQWMLPLLEALGYALTYQRRAAEVDGRSYAISHRAGGEEDGVPVHVVAFDQDLGDRPASGRGTLSPHALLQDYLNRTDEHLWGIVTNGRSLRLLRDSTYFTRPAYIEFDLQAMLEGERLDEFFLFYRLVHRTRLPQPGERPADCLLEQYYQRALEQGGRIRDGLRQAVADAIVTFANGFLRHPRNDALRGRLESGELTADGLYQQLLYLIYRLLFLMVAEERNLLELDGAGRQHGPSFYRRYTSVARLRTLADTPLSAPERFDDLYLGLRTLFFAFHDERLAQQLGVPPLNGELFSSDRAPDLDAAHLNNRDLLHAIRLLSYFTPPDEKVRRRVNYAALDVEELGSVYESLLDEQPVIDRPRQVLTFAFVSGTTRKTTGSYYTPRELVNEVVKSALVPVIQERLQRARATGSSPTGTVAATGSPAEHALLSLRVCDPACGSGHFLLAAARRIGYELAKVRGGADEPSPRQIRQATRDAITHCIYGVDKNPLAVDLCKVALWIEGYSRGRPLTFLDYRIRCGDSLVGVLQLDVLDEGIPDDAYQPVSGDDKSVARSLRDQNRQERAGQTSLFDRLDATAAAPDAAGWRALEAMPEDTPAQVNAKRAAYSALRGRDDRLRTAANLWTGAFFSHLTAENRATVATSDSLRRWRSGLPVNAQIVGEANGLAAENRFFHWPLEFPQVFDRDGFDVVLGNPPWERIKLQEQEFFATRDPEIATARNKAARTRLIARLGKQSPALYRAFQNALHNADSLSKFLRGSKRFPLTARGDINTYPVFAELGRSVLSDYGRAGMIVPSGLITDYTTSFFFRDLIETKSLIAFFGMDNEKMIFPGIDHRNKFGLLIEGGDKVEIQEAEFTFACSRIEDLAKPERRYSLGKDELFNINPNTGTCPTFRTKADAELTKKIYQRVPVLVNEASGSNPWQVRFATMFHMSNDSHLFASEPRPEHLPLYEAKMIWQFDHRYATYAGATQAQLNVGSLPKLDEADHQDPFRTVQPRYWVAASEVAAKLADWKHNWLIGFREVTNSVVERTVILSLLPEFAVGHKSPLIFVAGSTVSLTAMFLIGNLNSLPFDFVARQKIGGVSLSYFILNQLPVLQPSQYSEISRAMIAPRILELIYTAWDIAPFAADVWHDADETLRQALHSQWEANRSATGGHAWPAAGDPWAVHDSPKPPFPPFKWDAERRAHLRAELDAYYARLYGLTRDELRYILDPADIYGPDFPGETFRVLKEKEIKMYGEYRTQRLVLAAWDAQQAAIDRGALVVEPATARAEAALRERPAPYAPPGEAPATLQLKSPPVKPGPAPRPAARPPAGPALDARLLLPDLGLATRGSYSQRLKRVQALVADPSDTATAELVVFLAAPESGIQWVAQKALEKRDPATITALVTAFLEQTGSETGRRLAREVLAVSGGKPAGSAGAA